MAINIFLHDGAKTWVHHSGRTFVVDTNPRASRSSKSTKSLEGGTIESPMPGKILKVNVKAHDFVKENQTLCVIEAMKMEYALKSPCDGKLKNIFKSEGQLVQLGEKILEIEKV